MIFCYILAILATVNDINNSMNDGLIWTLWSFLKVACEVCQRYSAWSFRLNQWLEINYIAVGFARGFAWTSHELRMYRATSACIRIYTFFNFLRFFCLFFQSYLNVSSFLLLCHFYLYVSFIILKQIFFSFNVHHERKQKSFSTILLIFSVNEKLGKLTWNFS